MLWPGQNRKRTAHDGPVDRGSTRGATHPHTGVRSCQLVIHYYTSNIYTKTNQQTKTQDNTLFSLIISFLSFFNNLLSL